MLEFCRAYGNRVHEQRRVCFRHSIKVDSHSNHAGEQTDWAME